MPITPVNDNLLVEPVKTDERKIGSIVLADAAKDGHKRGVVLAVGPGRISEQGQAIPVRIKKGCTVIYSGHAADVDHDGKQLKLVGERAVLAVVDG